MIEIDPYLLMWLALGLALFALLLGMASAILHEDDAALYGSLPGHRRAKMPRSAAARAVGPTAAPPRDPRPHPSSD